MPRGHLPRHLPLTTTVEGNLLAPAMVIAALVVRTALDELRHPGSARQHWAFLRNPHAQVAGLSSGAAATLFAWPEAGSSAPAWAVLVGLLVAYLTGRRNAPPSSSEPPVRPSGLAGAFLTISGALLTLAGVILYILPGPGLPLLAVGCPLLIFGLVASTAERHRRKR